MADLIYVILTILFLAVSWVFIVFCERLLEEKK